ncbi:MAG: ribonuclease [Candidatus Petromonas sp.]|jgi:ribonuclease-3|nr:ribonuclease [Candidatus Petromonas sp.]
MNNTSYNKLEAFIGYEFINKDLLTEALTHSSFANEKKIKSNKYNERLEFLGDSVLGLIISEYLFRNYPELPEGKLTKIRAKIVCEPSLADCAKSIDLGNYLKLGKGEESTGGRNRTSILADAFEALIGSIYLDGGMENARKFIMKIMRKIIEDAICGKIFIDYKTRLQEILQADSTNKITYEIVDEIGPDHNKTFYTQVKNNDRIIGYGNGKNKKESEQNAAKMALKGVLNID